MMDRQSLREYLTDAIRYWEVRRLAYNAVLMMIVIGYFFAGYPGTKALLNVNFVMGLFLLAVLANVAYCAAYLVDIFAQASGFRDVWRKYRWVLFLVGILFAGIITRFIAMGMFAPAL